MPLPHEKHLYEYAVVRYVPRVEREEFVNVGLVMMCKRCRWIRTAVKLSPERLLALFPETDIDILHEQLCAFSRIATDKLTPLGELPVEERFRWLTAVRSACISTSRPHPGICDNLDETFEKLMAEQVL